MSNIREAEDAYLIARATFEDWKTEFMAQWYKPQYNLMMNMLARELTNLPPEVKSELIKKNPEGWKEVDKIVKGKVIEV